MKGLADAILESAENNKPVKVSQTRKITRPDMNQEVSKPRFQSLN